MSKLPERLKELMQEANLSQVALAEKTGIKNTNISDFLLGAHLPSYDNFLRLLYFFDCSADYLLGLDELHTDEKLLEALPFHERLRFLLKSQNISQSKLQRELPVSSSGVYGWLSGTKQPALVSLLRLSEYLDCSIDYLIGRRR